MISRRDLLFLGAGACAAGSAVAVSSRLRGNRWIDMLTERNATLTSRNDILTARNKKMSERLSAIGDGPLTEEGRERLAYYRSMRLKSGDVPRRIEIGCAIRNVGRGWYIMDDRNHAPLNIDRLIQHNDRLEVVYALPAIKVHTISVEPDDWFATNDTIVPGVSFGLESASIYFGRAGKLVPPSEVHAATGNFFVSGIMTCKVNVEDDGI